MRIRLSNSFTEYGGPTTTRRADMLLLIKGWLERKDGGRWLIIIDNADDTQVFFGGSVKPTNTVFDLQYQP